MLRKATLQICDDLLKSCPAPEGAASGKMRGVLPFAEQGFKPEEYTEIVELPAEEKV